MTQQIVPNIWCNRTAEEAGAFYATAFETTGFQASSAVTARYPAEGLLDFQRDLAGEALVVDLLIAGTQLALVNAGPEFSPNPSISFMVNFDPLFFGGDVDAARRGLDTLWAKLSDGGTTMMPVDEYPFAARYGWVQDRYGVSWQLMLTRAEGEPRPLIIPALMFDGPAQNRAAEAAAHYVSLFAGLPGGSEVGAQWPYGAPTGNATAEALAFGEFRIGDQWFMGSDNGSGVDHGFTAGVSLQVNCADQAVIDALWEGLSAVPEAEQCGWLVDKFGVSWQIVPANLGELMEREGAYERLMQMKKIVIAEL
ncbi:VOC family protein [Leucobacter aridicollis]|uniref:VOC family protein n=1 Tax=Leucobacter aridicollis TaxID=283878 RepID=UPI00210347A1|nr:VOC family protein [Leucobacter aridicollis]UTX52207.1 VOC family protein [Leucobacter aridicollis]